VFWVYILYCDNQSYYTGYTNNLAKRFAAHIKGNCKYTRSFKPLYIAQSWCISSDKSTAMQIESYIKKLPRSEKIILIENPNLLKIKFAQYQVFI
jgi:putative endonuclease